MAASVISTVPVQSSANAGSASVAIPTGATFCVITMSYFEASSNFTSNAITLDGQSAVLIEFNNQSDGHESISMYYVSGFATGSGKTFAWDWATGASTADEGVEYQLIFCSGLNVVDPIRDHKSIYTEEQSRVTITTPAITSTAADLVIGGASGYVSTIDMAGTRYSGQTELVTPGVYNSAQYDCARKAGASPSVTMSAYLQQGGLIAVSLKASADEPTAKTASDTGTGTDAGVDYPAAALVRIETGAGSDARGDYPGATLSSPDTGSGSEFALLMSALSGSVESGNGADISYSTAGLTSPDIGSAVDAAALLAVVLYAIETVSGSELAVLSLDSTVLTKSDSGDGSESAAARWLEIVEAGSGLDIASLVATMVRQESGTGAEVAAATLNSNDGGSGSELGALQKTAWSGDAGGAREALQSLIKTAGSTSDMRLSGRRAGEKMPSGREKTTSKPSRKPSKGVSI